LTVLKTNAVSPLPGEDAIRFAVRVTPRGGRDAIEGWTKDSAGNNQLKVRLRVAPEDGKANAALIALLAKALEVPRSSVAISSGEKARQKIIRAEGDPSALTARLKKIGVI
jgi:uncharacterized protein (TIGR00251 family)